MGDLAMATTHRPNSCEKLPPRDRLLWVNSRNYNANIVIGGFRLHTGPSLFRLANFGKRPEGADRLLEKHK